MITFRTLGRHGRLGNQLFQYALLVGIAERTGYDIVVPEGPLEGFRTTAARVPRKALRWKHTWDDRGSPDEFDPEVFDCEDGTAFHGLYQSYHYFAHAESRVRSEFRFTEEVVARTTEVTGRLRLESEGRPLVAVHARRGDYVRSPSHRAFEVSHLETAEEVLAVESPYYVVFSDDTEWCRARFPEDRFQVVDVPDPVQALCVASQCDHFVCSASTFSWWAAWLGTTSVDQSILIPAPWYPKPRVRSRMSPLHWKRVVLDPTAFAAARADGHPAVVFEGRHPHWKAELYFWTHGRMVRPGACAGNWSAEPNGRLVLDWDNWPEERLSWDVEDRVYRDDEGRFTLIPPIRFRPDSLETPGLRR